MRGVAEARAARRRFIAPAGSGKGCNDRSSRFANRDHLTRRTAASMRAGLAAGHDHLKASDESRRQRLPARRAHVISSASPRARTTRSRFHFLLRRNGAPGGARGLRDPFGGPLRSGPPRAVRRRAHPLRSGCCASRRSNRGTHCRRAAPGRCGRRPSRRPPDRVGRR